MTQPHWCRHSVVSVWIAFLSLVAIGESSFMSSTQADPLRRRTEDAAYSYDISDFSIRFGKCQHVKMYDDEIAQDEDWESVFAVKHFVVYRMCPTDECETCSDTYGEYVVELEDYLQIMGEWQKIMFENMCENCNENCNDDGDSCSGCGQLCYQYENMEANGYVDATDYIECQQIDVGGDDDDDGDQQLYVGPRCSRDGTHILISLFSDENCWEPYTDQDAEDVLGVKLSYHVIADTYSDSACLSCKEDADDGNQNDQDDADEVNEMCEEIYSSSAKCESIHGIEQGFVDMNREENDYENQVENEFAVCTFIDSLVFNSYTETGEINIEDEQDEIIYKLTPLQATVLSLLSVTVIGLGLYGWYLHRKIGTHFPKVNLACQRGGTQLS